MESKSTTGLVKYILIPSFIKRILTKSVKFLHTINKKLIRGFSALTLISLLLTSCSIFNPAPPPPEEGVLIAGDPNALAADNLIDLPPVGVDQTQIENGIILTRLDVRIAPDATVAQINDALQQVNGGIVSMSPEHLAMTVAVPRQASIEALQELADTLSDAAGIRYAFLGRQMVADDWPVPTDDIDYVYYDFSHHLIPTRFPAAWNLGQNLVNCEPVPILIADYFSPTPPGDFTNQVPIPGFPGIVMGDDDWGDHGYYVTSILAAKFDALRPTGANPFIECLDLRAIDLSGFTSGATTEMIARAFPPEKFVLNASFGFDSTCDNESGIVPCDSESIIDEMHTPYQRAQEALLWKEVTHGRWNDFVAVVAAGNEYDEESTQIYAGMGEAPYTNEMSIVTRDDLLFRFIEDGRLWNPSEAYVTFPSLVAEQGDVSILQTTIRDKGMDTVPPARNVLIVGSTNNILAKFPDINTVTESDFSNRHPDVTTVGQEVWPTCYSDDTECIQHGVRGTSFAAPQVTGLVAYLWLLSPDLRDLPASITRDAILANTRPLASPVIDAYAAALSLDGTSAPSRTSTPNRFALLNVVEDIEDIANNKVDENDIANFLAKYFDMSGNPEEPGVPDFSRHDLNGDGYTGGPGRDRFDLDRTGSIQFGASVYSEAILVLPEPEGEVVYYDENTVTDLDILCYYMYSGLYTGDTNRRTQLLTAPCLGNIVLPDAVTLSDGRTRQFEAFLLGEGEIVWTAEGGTITSAGLYTAGGDAGTFTVRAARGDAFAEAEVIIDVAPQPEPTLAPEPEITPVPETTPELGPDQVLSEDNIRIIVDDAPPPQASFTVNLTALTGDGGTQTHAITYPPGNGQQVIITRGTDYRVTIAYNVDRNGTTIYWTLPGCGPQLFWRSNSVPPSGGPHYDLTGEFTYVIHC